MRPVSRARAAPLPAVCATAEDDLQLVPFAVAAVAEPAQLAMPAFEIARRLRPDALRTAMATAFFWLTITTSLLPRVRPVLSRLRCSIG